MNLDPMGRAALLGALTGLRSTAGPAALARELGNRRWWRTPRRGPRAWLADEGVQTALTAAAIGEMVADKLPGIRYRTRPLPLGARALVGGTLGALVAGRKASWPERIAVAAVGSAAAVVTATVVTRARDRVADGTVSDRVAGLVEDAAVAAAARWLGA